MKKLFVSLLMATTFGSWASATERVELKPVSSMVQAGTVEYSFDLHDTITGKMIEDSKLKTDMTKKLHMIVYDPSLREFQHSIES